MTRYVTKIQRFFSGIAPHIMMTDSKPTYLKAMTVHDSTDLDIIRRDIREGMILIMRVGPMAQKDIQELRNLISELYNIAKENGAEIARLGDERVVVAPSGIQIWKPQYDLK